MNSTSERTGGSTAKHNCGKSSKLKMQVTYPAFILNALCNILMRCACKIQETTEKHSFPLFSGILENVDRM